MGFLDKLFGSRPPESLHPVFGRMIFQRDRQGAYWECELQPENPDGPCATVLAGAEGPSEAQAEFFRRTVDDLDPWVAQSRPLLNEAFAAMTGRTLADDWRRDLRFCGMTVPAGAEATADWDLCLVDTGRNGIMYTVELRDGRPVNVLTDG